MPAYSWRCRNRLMFQHDATNIHARSTITGARRFSRITGIVPSSARRSPLDPDPHFLGLHPVTVCFQSKKTLNLGFLDFSTLEKRRHCCERELKLNRRLAPEIYLDVVPIYKSSSGFSFNALFSTLRFRAGHTANCCATNAAKRTRDGKSSNSMSIFPRSSAG